MTGTPGLDLRGWISGGVGTGKTSTDFTFTVYNAFQRLAGGEPRQHPPEWLAERFADSRVAADAAEQVGDDAAGQSVQFTFTYKSPSALATGANLHIQACVDVLGDFYPINNCSAVDQTNGPTALTTSQDVTFIIHTQTANAFPIKVKNISNAAFNFNPFEPVDEVQCQRRAGHDGDGLGYHGVARKGQYDEREPGVEPHGLPC